MIATLAEVVRFGALPALLVLWFAFDCLRGVPPLRRTLAALLFAAAILVIVGGTVVSLFFMRVNDPAGTSPAGVGLAWAFWAGFRLYLVVGVCCVLAGFRIGRRRST